ncbi:MAG: cytochrome C oxidase subunit IV family protein [Candidatus Omnitrophica bacterium]|nr:cytochrome C oxidase subunit IV family protein [Candidatus Omnitrophota bacterium]
MMEAHLSPAKYLWIIKATLVALYYMHLKSDKRALILVAVFPLVLVGLAVLVVLSSRFVRL